MIHYNSKNKIKPEKNICKGITKSGKQCTFAANPCTISVKFIQKILLLKRKNNI